MKTSFGIFTDLGNREIVFLLDGASTEKQAQECIHFWETKPTVFTGQRFWFHELFPGFDHTMRRLTGGDVIRFRYPDHWDATELDAVFADMSIDEKINAGYYTPLSGLFSFNRKMHQAEEGRLIQLFIHDVAVDLDMVDHPKFNALYNKAYEMGHSNGLHDVLSYARDFAELVK